MYHLKSGDCPPGLTAGKTVDFHRSSKSLDFLLEHIFLTAPPGSVIYCAERYLLRQFISSKLDTHEGVFRAISGAAHERCFGWETTDQETLNDFKTGQLELIGIVGPLWDHRPFLRNLGGFSIQIYHIDLSPSPLAYMAYASAVTATKKCVFYFSDKAHSATLDAIRKNLQI